MSYEMIWKYDQVHDIFDKCGDEHLHNPEIRNQLYEKGLSDEVFTERLLNVIYPVYLSARTCGFSPWKYEAETV